MSITNSVPQGADPALLIQGDFILIRTAMVDALGGDYPAAIVFQRIVWRCERGEGTWTATREDIERETRLSTWQVKGALTKLQRLGWLRRERASAYDATSVWSPILHVDVEESSTSEMAESSISTVLEDVETTPSPAGESEPDRFTEFWTLWPRKVSKRDARRAWDKAVRKATPDAILTGVRSFIAVESRRPEYPRYVPHPATWLNAERWEDELTTPVPNRSAAVDDLGIW